MNGNKKLGRLLMLIGGAFIAVALAMVIYNIALEKRAEKSHAVAELLSRQEVSIAKEKTTLKNEVPDYELNPQMELPTTEVQEETYIGRLSLHSLGLSLPIMDEWDYRKLKIAPCRYTGSPYSGDFIIAGHYYDSHFGAIDELQPGDKITFTDVAANSFEYEVLYVELLEDTDVELMQEGQWDLTIFTCTYDTEKRITVRTKRIK